MVVNCTLVVNGNSITLHSGYSTRQFARCCSEPALITHLVLPLYIHIVSTFYILYLVRCRLKTTFDRHSWRVPRCNPNIFFLTLTTTFFGFSCIFEARTYNIKTRWTCSNLLKWKAGSLWKCQFIIVSTVVNYPGYSSPEFPSSFVPMYIYNTNTIRMKHTIYMLRCQINPTLQCFEWKN